MTARERAMLALLEDLLAWAEYMGGWEAPCWKRALRYVRRMRVSP